MLITNGFLIADDTLAAANANPDVEFIGIDQFQPNGYPANYIGVLFREDQGGYLAGVMAASLSKSGVIGVVGGREDVPPVVRYVNAYKTGAESVNPDIRVLSTYNESFTDPNKGASDAQQFMGEGADVVFGAGGQDRLRRHRGGRGRPASGPSAWTRTSTSPPSTVATRPGSQYLATSAIKRVDLSVFRNIVAAMNDTFKGGVYTLEAANDGITYAPPHDADISDDISSKMADTQAGLADGSIDTGVDPVTGLPK